jgi:hypothetical protein
MYQYSTEELNDAHNQAIAVFLDALLEEGLITDEQNKEFSKYQVVLKKSSKFNNWIKKLIGLEKSDDEQMRINIMKFVN